MGICRASRYKNRVTGGVQAIHQKKRKFELGRPAANTKLGGYRVHLVRCRGGNIKRRALRLEQGGFAWTSEQQTFKTKIMSVVYNPTSMEFVRTNTITKNTIVTVDATPFRNWYYRRYGVELGKKHEGELPAVSEKAAAGRAARNANQQLEAALEDQFNTGRLLACISSRPGQSGRADGYILEGKELAFYKKKMDKKRK